MLMPWISSPAIRKVAIVGICKNAGKTSVLNAIIQQHNTFKWGVMSTGRDGEAEDVLFKTPKPRVRINPGSYFCADTACMDANGSAITIQKKTTWKSGGTCLWLARAERSLETEIGGPQTVSAQTECAMELLKLGADKVIIDGSLDRKSIALSDSLDVLILSVGASFGDLNAIQTELMRLLSLAEIPPYHVSSETEYKLLLTSETIQLKHKNKWHDTGLKSLLGGEKQLISLLTDADNCSHIYIPGAFTINTNTRLGRHLNMQILFRHPECLKLPQTELAAFITIHHPQCLIPFNIKAITLNSTAVGASPLDADVLRQQLRSSFPNMELIDIMEASQI